MPRVISIPTARDRIVLKSLANMLIELFPGAEGVVPQLRVEAVRRALLSGRRNAYVRIDVREFYPSVPHETVRERLAIRIRKTELLSVLMAAISTPTVPDGHPMKSVPTTVGVPQGLAVSNLLAEIVAQSVDSNFVNDSRVDYFRFVDDVLLLCDQRDAAQLFGEVSAAFDKVGLIVHPLGVPDSKSAVGSISGGFDYLGYVFKGSRITVRKASVRRLESSLARVFTKYSRAISQSETENDADRALARCTWEVNLIVSGCVYRDASRGWLQYFRQMDDLVLLKRLDAAVGRFARRFDLPSSFSPKLFVRVYWMLRHPRGDVTGYIPNFDKFSHDQMRLYLRDIIGRSNTDKMSDEYVASDFFKMIARDVSKLETDIGFVS